MVNNQHHRFHSLKVILFKTILIYTVKFAQIGAVSGQWLTVAHLVEFCVDIILTFELNCRLFSVLKLCSWSRLDSVWVN